MRTLIALLVIGLGVGAAAAARAGDTTFTLNASVDCCEAGEHRFGWLDEAATGLDPNDVPEPPLPLGPYLAAAFSVPGVTSPDRWRRDLRATADFDADGREAWELSFAVSSLPATCTVTITPGIGDAGGLLLLVSGAFADTLAVPATFSFPIGSGSLLGLEVVREALPNATTPWGALKCAYR